MRTSTRPSLLLLCLTVLVALAAPAAAHAQHTPFSSTANNTHVATRPLAATRAGSAAARASAMFRRGAARVTAAGQRLGATLRAARAGLSRSGAVAAARGALGRLNAQRLALRRAANITRLRLYNTMLVRLGLRSATFSNPVIDEDFADPSFEYGHDGALYAYATQDGHDNIQLRRSTDGGVTWRRMPDALPARAPWSQQSRNTWAPHVVHHDGTYYMYFSGQVDEAWARAYNTGRPPEEHIEPGSMAIGVATSRSPQGPFRPAAHPLQTGHNFQAIDAMAFDDPRTGRPILYWGSSDLGIMARELDASRTGFAPGSRAVQVLRTGTERPYERLLEAAHVLYNPSDQHYYLLTSGDNCCGESAHYAVLAARSRDPMGPFEMVASADHPGTSAVLARSDRAIAPGHNGMFSVGGEQWIGFHYIDPRNAGDTGSGYSRRPMAIAPFRVVDGQPRAGANGTTPLEPQPRPGLGAAARAPR